jgi:hypothetical protein
VVETPKATEKVAEEVKPVDAKSNDKMEDSTIVKELGKKPELETPTMVRFSKRTESDSESKMKTHVKVDRSKFGKTLLKATASRPYISGYIDTYLENGYSFRYEEKYSAQTNLYFLPE